MERALTEAQRNSSTKVARLFFCVFEMLKVGLAVSRRFSPRPLCLCGRVLHGRTNGIKKILSESRSHGEMVPRCEFQWFPSLNGA